jgi:hypothetical protein
MSAFFAEPNAIKRDEIAIRQLVGLNEYLGRRQQPLRVSDVKEVVCADERSPLRKAAAAFWTRRLHACRCEHSSAN